jgi:hypothetical protein
LPTFSGFERLDGSSLRVKPVNPRVRWDLESFFCFL